MATGKKKQPGLRDRFITVRTPAENARGYRDRSVYAGPWVVWRGEEAALRSNIRAICLLTLLEMLLLLPGVSRLFGVNWYLSATTFGLLSVLPALFQLFGALRLFFSRKKPFTVMDRDALNRELGVVPVVAAVFCFLTALSQVLLLISHFHASSLAAPVLTITGGILALLSRARFLLLEAETRPNDVKRGLKELVDKSTGLGTGVYVDRKRRG